MTQQALEVQETGSVQLRCPECGNCGQEPFTVDAYLTVDGKGKPAVLGAWTAADPEMQRVSCHACELLGPVAWFVQPGSYPGIAASQ